MAAVVMFLPGAVYAETALEQLGGPAVGAPEWNADIASAYVKSPAEQSMADIHCEGFFKNPFGAHVVNYREKVRLTGRLSPTKGLLKIASDSFIKSSRALMRPDKVLTSELYNGYLGRVSNYAGGEGEVRLSVPAEIFSNPQKAKAFTAYLVFTDGNDIACPWTPKAELSCKFLH